MYGKFWFDSDIFVRNLDANVELRKLSLGPVFFFFFFFSFFYQVLSSAFDFSIGKIFSKAKNSSCELYKVRDVNKIWK